MNGKFTELNLMFEAASYLSPHTRTSLLKKLFFLLSGGLLAVAT
jgi:hypothetical protein